MTCPKISPFAPGVPTTDRGTLGLLYGAAWLADMAGWEAAGGDWLRRVDSQVTRVELDGLLGTLAACHRKLR